ncbi:TonB-dependent receptor [Advenella sp. WQ 585]|uniref:TonB-dependent receptor n=1 Tax=Advenella mandrilli TaxID=2800330 RepID=A0ABS1E8S5_9BURK|nr:TonB-dependent receptor [Advenella mandrilli]MBK1780076.1 TonB-dependent receptor [Advenella mandrilli]
MSVPHQFNKLKLIVVLSAVWANSAIAQETVTLPAIRATLENPSSLRVDTDREQARLNQVPGGTNLVKPQEHIRLNVLRDALDHQPGIIVQDFFGGIDQPRLNIRGSGIQSNPVNRGVLLMQDGLPLNEADGSFVIGFLEPRNSGLISVRRGANAISPSATTLGGELDFQSLTGTEGNQIGIGLGSFGYWGVNGEIGLEGDTFDGRISFSHDKSNGYRHHSSSRRSSFNANLGFRRDNFENRTYLSYTDLKFDIPNVIPKARMYDDPRSVLGDYNEQFDRVNNIYLRDPNRKSSQFRVANQSYWGTEALNQTFGLYWQTIDDTFTSPLVSTPTDGHTYGAQWQLAGQAGSVDYRVALNWSRSDMDRDLYAVNPANGSRMQRFGSYSMKAENRNALLGLNWHFAPDWSAVADIKFSQAIRNVDGRHGSANLNQDWSYTSPRIGLIWKPSDSLRLYANISRSNEAPTYWEIINGDVPNPMNPASATTSLSKLDLQRALTYEIGADGRFGSEQYAMNWSLSLYHSKVKDELMSVSTENGTAAGTFNYRGKTRHQGIEAGINGVLPGFGNGLFDYRLAYTLSDFRFRGGEFAGNQIAGVPKHMLSAELMYRTGGWRFGPNVRWMASKTPTNHANIDGTEQDSYALLGFKIAYEHNKHWSAYIAADNLTDNTYASSYVIRNTATAMMPTFLTGNGRSVSGGISFKF